MQTHCLSRDQDLLFAVWLSKLKHKLKHKQTEQFTHNMKYIKVISNLQHVYFNEKMFEKCNKKVFIFVLKY